MRVGFIALLVHAPVLERWARLPPYQRFGGRAKQFARKFVRISLLFPKNPIRQSRVSQRLARLSRHSVTIHSVTSHSVMLVFIPFQSIYLILLLAFLRVVLILRSALYFFYIVPCACWKAMSLQDHVRLQDAFRNPVEVFFVFSGKNRLIYGPDFENKRHLSFQREGGNPEV